MDPNILSYLKDNWVVQISEIFAVLLYFTPSKYKTHLHIIYRKLATVLEINIFLLQLVLHKLPALIKFHLEIKAPNVKKFSTKWQEVVPDSLTKLT